MGKEIKKRISKLSRLLHRELSFIFAGVILIYAISGLFMNHQSSVNPRFIISKTEYQLEGNFPKQTYSKDDIMGILRDIDEDVNYTKHYFPSPRIAKIFMQHGSSLTIDLDNGQANYESIKRRPIISGMIDLHYNPNQWWTIFSDIFAVSLIVITITGIILVKGRKGFFGIGGLKILVGIIIPILLLFLT